MVVIRTNRGQSVPTSFERIDVNLNKGSWGDDVYIWYVGYDAYGRGLLCAANA